MAPWKLLTGAVFLWTLLLVISSGYEIQRRECEDCTGRTDVPCRVQRMVSCHYPAFDHTWPGKPNALSAEQVIVGEDWVANFTWKPPYDASFVHLDGFFLTVNRVVHHYGAIFMGHPDCYFTNLTGTNWSGVREPHSVTFHFDCIKAQVKTEVHVLLMSSPVPSATPPYSDATLVLEGQMDGCFRFYGPSTVFQLYEPVIMRREDEAMEEPASEPGIGIGPAEQPASVWIRSNVTVDVTGKPLINVKFGSGTTQNLTTDVCLVEYKNGTNIYSECVQRKTLPAGQHNTTFSNITPQLYQILVRLGNDNDFYASEIIRVTEPPPAIEEPPQSHHVQIIISILVCLIVVVIATTSIFCLKRHYGVDFCKRHYHPTHQNVPNNTQENYSDVAKPVLPLYYPESKEYKTAVEECISFLQQRSGVEVLPSLNFSANVSTMTTSIDDVLKKRILLFLSDTICKVLDNTDDQGQDERLDGWALFFSSCLRRLRESGKINEIILVALLPLDVENMPRCIGSQRTLCIVTETSSKKQESRFELNFSNIHQLMTELNKNFEAVHTPLSNCVELSVVLNRINNLAAAQAKGGNSSQSKADTNCMEECRLQSRASKESSVFWDRTEDTPNSASNKQENLVVRPKNGISIPKYQTDVRKSCPNEWHRSRCVTNEGITCADPLSGHHHTEICRCIELKPCSECTEDERFNMQYYAPQNKVPSVIYTHQDENYPFHQGFSPYRERGVTQSGQDINLNFTGYRGQEPTFDSGYQPSAHSENSFFLPPDSDGESDSASMVAQQLAEINNRNEGRFTAGASRV